MYEEVAGARLTELVDRAPRPPMVSADLPGGRVHAALLVWARAAGRGWVGGVAYLHRTWHDRALVTAWVAALALTPHPSADYRHVPRVALTGDPAAWPSLPPRYPHAGPDWMAAHRHAGYVAPP